MGWFKDMFVPKYHHWLVMNPSGRGQTVDPKMTEAYREFAKELLPGLTGPFPPDFKPFGQFWEKRIDG